MAGQIHVFVGTFTSREDACLYTESQWEPEPDDSVSDEEYVAWEDRNPTWGIRDDLGEIYLDSDFIETIDGDDRYEYLASYLVNPSDINAIRSMAGAANILVLVFPDALGGFQADFKSTSNLTYCGGFDFSWP